MSDFMSDIKGGKVASFVSPRCHAVMLDSADSDEIVHCGYAARKSECGSKDIFVIAMREEEGITVQKSSVKSAWATRSNKNTYIVAKKPHYGLGCLWVEVWVTEDIGSCDTHRGGGGMNNATDDRRADPEETGQKDQVRSAVHMADEKRPLPEKNECFDERILRSGGVPVLCPLGESHTAGGMI